MQKSSLAPVPVHTVPLGRLPHAVGRRWLSLFLASLTVAGLVGARAQAAGLVSGCTELGLLTALEGGGTVTFNTDCNITLTRPIEIGTGGTVVDAQGHKVVLSGNNTVSLFNVTGNLTLLGLTLANGKSTNGGGAVVINSGAVVVASNCTFIANSVVAPNGSAGANGANSTSSGGGNGGNGTAGGVAAGGALYNYGTLRLFNCVCASNSVTGGNGGAGGKGGNGDMVGGNGGSGGAGGNALGGAVYSQGTLLVSNCTFSANRVTGGNGALGGTNGTGTFSSLAGVGGAGGGGTGGAIHSGKSALVVVNCTFSDNRVQAGASSGGGSLENGNGADGQTGPSGLGGAILSASTAGMITNCTFVNDQVNGGNGGNGGNGSWTAGNGGDGGSGLGGGVHNVGSGWLVNCTFSGCGAFGGTNGVAGTGSFAGQNGSLGLGAGGDVANGSGSLTLLNTILAAATHGGCGYGSVADGGYNLTADASLALGSSSSVNTDAKLLALADNGGPTKTMNLASTNSPAWNRVPSWAAPPFDQRGLPRPINGLAEIGACEYELLSKPIITQPPTNPVVTFGTAATLRVGTSGGLPMFYQWYLDGVPIAGATTSSYVVTNAVYTNDGPYAVSVSNRFGYVFSGDVGVGLVPVVTSQPTNQTVLVGSNAWFSVHVDGDPVLTYQWRLNGTNVPGATSSNLVISAAQPSDVGSYTAFIANDWGSVTSAPAVLRMPPSILVPPTNQLVNVGATANFSVVADGGRPLSFQWLFNGANLAGATNANLSVANVQGTNAGIYAVVVTNAFGSLTSTNARLDVRTALVSSPTNATVPAGSVVTLAVNAVGSLPLTYQWLFNGTNLGGATGPSLVLSNVQLPNVGTYVAVVTNAFNAVTSAPAALNLLPTILVGPSNQVTTAGSPASFAVAATGNQPLAYQWRLEGTNLLSATNSSYAIAKVQATNLGNYTVFITNAVGAVTSAPALLTLGVPPALTAGPTNLAVSAGSNAVFQVTAAGTAPLSYQWSFGGTNLPGATTSSLTVANVQLTNLGAYSVVVTNSYGSASNFASLYLLPSILSQPVDQTVAAGSNATFSVRVIGSPTLGYQWRFGGTNLVGAPNADTYTLVASVANSGAYSVRITNAYGSVTSSIANLQLGYGPQITAQPTNLVLLAGASATFRVASTGTAPLSVQWQLNGANLAGASGNILTVANVQQTDIGDYSAVVTNAFGSARSAKARLDLRPTILGQPASLAVSVGSNATFSVNVAASAPVAYQWRWNGTNTIRGATNSSYTVLAAQVTNAGAYSVTITNAFGGTNSASATLGLLPTVLSSPASLTVLQGSNASFSVVASGSPTLGYQWRRNGTNVAGATLASLSFKAAQLTNAGAYDVVLANAYGRSTSAVASLTVVLPFTISGRVLDVDGTNGLAGVTVCAGGTNTAVTDADGKYLISNLRSNAYTVTAALNCYRFSPTNAVVVVGPGNLGAVDFTAAYDYHSIAGTITADAGDLSQVSVAVVAGSTDIVASVQLSNGAFALSNLCAGTYTVVPSGLGYRFSPASLPVTIPPDTNSLAFTATAIYTLSGEILNASSNGMIGRPVVLTGNSLSNVVTTDESGTVTFTGLEAGTYTVTPTPVRCFHFDPPSQTVSLPGGALQPFIVRQDAYVISGRLLNNGVGVSNVTVSLSTGAGQLTGPDGRYAFSNLCAGTYRVVPAKACYNFSPSILTVAVAPSTTTADIAATPDVYSISGYVKDDIASGVSNVLVTAGSQSAKTDANGYYQIAGLCPGTYTVTPSLACHAFVQPPQTVSVGPSVTEIDFTAVDDNLHTISGWVTADGVHGLGGVTVSFGSQSAVTDSNGTYQVTGLCPGTNALTPSLVGYGFSPAYRPLNLTTNLSGMNFVAYNAYTISGQLLEGTNLFGGASLRLTGGGTNLTIFATNGTYNISGLSSNLYTLTPLSDCYLFGPTNQVVNLGPTNAGAVDFAVTHDVHVIQGTNKVSDAGLAGVTLTLILPGSSTNSVTSDANGVYSFTNLCPGIYTVIPSLKCYLFYPTSSVVSVSSGAGTFEVANFNAAPNLVQIRGQVSSALGKSPLAGVTVSLTNGSQAVQTDAAGNYVLPNLCPGSYWLRPSLPGYMFDPPALQVNLQANQSGVGFTAFPLLSLGRQTNGAARLALGAPPGLAYQVYASTDLVNWVRVFTTNNVLAHTMLLQFIDAEATNYPARFYKVTETPWLRSQVGSNGTVLVSFGAPAGQVYQLEASSDLVSWSTVFTNAVSNDPALAQFLETQATNYPARFYRIKP